VGWRCETPEEEGVQVPLIWNGLKILSLFSKNLKPNMKKELKI